MGFRINLKNERSLMLKMRLPNVSFGLPISFGGVSLLSDQSPVVLSRNSLSSLLKRDASVIRRSILRIVGFSFLGTLRKQGCGKTSIILCWVHLSRYEEVSLFSFF